MKKYPEFQDDREQALEDFSSGDKPYMAIAHLPRGSADAEHRIIDRQLRVLAVVDPDGVCADPAGLAECIARDMNTAASGASASNLVGLVRELADALEETIETHIYDGDEPANAPERAMVANARAHADRAERVSSENLALPPVAFAAIFEHKHGRTITIHATREQADATRQAVAFQSWEELFPEEPKPDDMEEMANRYFARATEIGDEFFSIEECPVDGFTPQPVDALLTALRAIKDRWPSNLEPPTPEGYEVMDTESAYNNGEDVSTHEAAVIAGQALDAYAAGTAKMEWTKPKHPGDHLRRTDLRKGDDLGFITIQSWNDITFRIGAFLPGNTIFLPGDTPKTEPEKDEWATREAADSIFDRYVEEAKSDGWEVVP